MEDKKNEPGMVERQTYSLEEVATILGISRGLTYAAAKAGKIPTIRIGRRLVVPRGAFTRLLENEGSGGGIR